MSQAGPTLLDVTGETRLYVVIGDPIVQVRSTALYNKLSAKKGVNAVFVPVQFSAERFDEAIAGLRSFKNLGGVIPTIPHKARMLSVVDEAAPRARMVGAVNSIRVDPEGRWIGEAFDGVGYVEGLKERGRDPAGKSVQLVGLGGAGASMAFALAEAAVSRLRIFDLDNAKIERVKAGLSEHYPALTVESGPVLPREVDIVANATPLGMKESDPLPFDPDALRPGQLVTDMIMAPPVTALLRAAEARGCPIQVGYEALLGQAKANIAFFGFA
jgi:shikimate dehydrogenase